MMKGRFVHAALAAIMVAAVTGVAACAALDDQSPGTVTGTEAVPASLSIPGAGTARKLTYWTRTSDDRPALSTGQVFTPQGTPPAEGWPVISWEHGTVGVAEHLAPSLTRHSDRDQTYLRHWLEQGYAVVATDYIGLGTPGGHAYLDGRAEAHAGIDMVRAARSVNDTLAAKWVALGQSQGGGAAVFTAALATSYAPELDFRGTVATAPGDGAPLVDTIIAYSQPAAPPTSIGPFTASYSTYILAGAHTARPEFDPEAYLSSLGKRIYAEGQTAGILALSAATQGVTPRQLFSRPLSDGPFPALAHALYDFPATGYDRPLFLGHGLADTDVPAPFTRDLIARLQAAGVQPEVHFYDGQDHSGAMLASVPDSTPFIARLFA
ncbi:lipase family protein [Amycolatopsis azurea]|uniref:lipase family protein n=1 Tax=Amycolatopsis azurea TaxID=36819 RepID=UPI003829136B